jgi:hypothetical protein
VTDLQVDQELLEHRRLRFLGAVLSECMNGAWRTPEQFLEWFPPSNLINALEAEHELRWRLLVEVAAVPERLARGRSSATAAKDLQLALEDGRADARRLLEYLPIGVLVRCLDTSTLWKFATGGQWLIQASIDPSARPVALDRLGRILRCALREELVTLVDLTGNVPLGELSAHASPEQLRGVFQYALWCAEGRTVPDPERLLELINAPELFANWPVEHTWKRIIVDQIAVPYGLETLAPPRRDRDSHLRLKPATPPPMRLHTGMGASEKGDEALESADEPTLQQPPLVAEAAPERAKEPIRRSAIEDRLRQIDRLPPNHRYLSVAILKSIALMYDEIKKHRGRAARALCVRACFANEAHLRAGILSLLELLDPSSSSLLADSASEELIEALLMQERAIWQRARARRIPPPPNTLAAGPAARRAPFVPRDSNATKPGAAVGPSGGAGEEPAAEGDATLQPDRKFTTIRPPPGDEAQDPSNPRWRH